MTRDTNEQNGHLLITGCFPTTLLMVRNFTGVLACFKVPLHVSQSSNGTPLPFRLPHLLDWIKNIASVPILGSIYTSKDSTFGKAIKHEQFYKKAPVLSVTKIFPEPSMTFSHLFVLKREGQFGKNGRVLNYVC